MTLNTTEFGVNLRLWTGIVEDRGDPLGLGRVKVRIFGAYGKEIPKEKLPWAVVLMPATNAGVGGIGSSPVGLVEGSLVVCTFMDGLDMQQPIVLGSLNTIEGLAESQQGTFNADGASINSPHNANFVGDGPPWMQIARGEIGVKEIKGSQHSPRVLEYAAANGFSDDETPWPFESSTEVLTTEGWVALHDLTSTSIVAKVVPLLDPDTNERSFELDWELNPVIVANNEAEVFEFEATSRHEFRGLVCGVSHPWITRFGRFLTLDQVPAMGFQLPMLSSTNFALNISDEAIVALASYFMPTIDKYDDPLLNSITQDAIAEAMKHVQLRNNKSSLKLSSIMNMNHQQSALFIKVMERYSKRAKNGEPLLKASNAEFRDNLQLLAFKAGRNADVRAKHQLQLLGSNFVRIQPKHFIRRRRRSTENLMCIKVESGLTLLRVPGGNPFIAKNCSSFVKWCMKQAGQSTEGATGMARSWLTASCVQPIDEPLHGCIAVFARGTDGIKGHVGFLDSIQGGRHVLLGGNQSDSVCIQGTSSPLLGYRWPVGVPTTSFNVLSSNDSDPVPTGSED